jgi:anti-anti-sigma factor
MSAGHETETIGDVTVLRLHDPSLMAFESIPATTELCETFFRDSPTEKTLLNFGQIEFYNSISLGMIASLGKKAERFGRSVAICNLNPKSVWSIQAARLHTILDIYHDEELALSMLQQGDSQQAGPVS